MFWTEITKSGTSGLRETKNLITQSSQMGRLENLGQMNRIDTSGNLESEIGGHRCSSSFTPNSQICRFHHFRSEHPPFNFVSIVNGRIREIKLLSKHVFFIFCAHSFNTIDRDRGAGQFCNRFIFHTLETPVRQGNKMPKEQNN